MKISHYGWIILVTLIAKLWHIFPKDKRAYYLYRMVEKITHSLTPREAMELLMTLDNSLYQLHGKTAVRFGRGKHPKHNLIHYHDFFTSHLNPGDNVLDIGCGNGDLSYSMAKSSSKIKVTGFEINKRSVSTAKKRYRAQNLKYIQGDILKEIPMEHFNVIVLSNVLEHFEKRVALLKRIIRIVHPQRLLIRVPSFERDWRVPMKKELGVDYRLDDTHFIEYTQQSFIDEVEQSGLKLKSLRSVWGEFWCVLVPTKKKPISGKNAKKALVVAKTKKPTSK